MNGNCIDWKNQLWLRRMNLLKKVNKKYQRSSEEKINKIKKWKQKAIRRHLTKEKEVNGLKKFEKEKFLTNRIIQGVLGDGRI